jgi:hypothetical protein
MNSEIPDLLKDDAIKMIKEVRCAAAKRKHIETINSVSKNGFCDNSTR